MKRCRCGAPTNSTHSPRCWACRDRHNRARMRDRARKYNTKRAARRKERIAMQGKLSVSDVIGIKTLLGKGWTQARVAERYGVSHQTVSELALGKRGHDYETKRYRDHRQLADYDPGLPTWPSRCDTCGCAVTLEPDWLGVLHAVCNCPPSRKVA